MVDFGHCGTCNDSCVIVNEISKDNGVATIVTCVKNCSKIMGRGTAKFTCEECLERFNTGKRLKSGELVK